MGYKSKKSLAKDFDISPRLVSYRFAEMKKLPEYGNFYINDSRMLRISESAFEHYLRNRNAIKNGRSYQKYKT